MLAMASETATVNNKKKKKNKIKSNESTISFIDNNIHKPHTDTDTDIQTITLFELLLL